MNGEFDADNLFGDLVDKPTADVINDTPEGTTLLPSDEVVDDQLPPLPIPDIPNISDLDDLGDQPQNTPSKPAVNELVEKLLASKGIEGTKVRMLDENDEEQEIDFYELSPEDQLSILNSNDSDINFGLEDSEIETINFLRKNNVTFEEAREYFRREAVKEYIDSQNIAGIEIDNYTDEELYALELKAKYEELTQEEIEIELAKQLEHPELFKKKVDKLRVEYKQIEEEQLKNARLQEEQVELQKTEDLKNNLVSVANEVEDIGGLDLDVNDKNEVLNFILGKDINGVSPLLKALDDPKQLFNLAWYAVKGEQAFSIIHDYYKKQIDQVSKTAYAKGKSEAAGKAPKPTERKTFSRTTPGVLPPTNDSHPSLDDVLAQHLK